MTQEQVVNIATEISYLMLKNGAEIYRVEQCVRFIANAYGYYDADCFAILTSIVVSVVDGDKVCTRTKRVTDRGTDFNKVVALNDLSRNICRECMDYETIMKRINEIRRTRPYPFWVSTVMYIMISFFFGLYFGGTFITACICGVAGVVVYPVQWFARKIQTNIFIANMITSGVITILLSTFYVTFYPKQLDIMLISLIMNLVPGVALTHCMRDLISNELISGLARLAEVFISGAGTAAGVFIVLSVFGLQI
ncbi:threonine/serine exporter family protein [[Clostridium] polysaccharolyticum]|uniref:Uncharacterized membrane protein YjjP, DUF1212 family n=1 Tax=[Clostridium] polysaccharolyticum TaxID=29364 RepID=A0A1I0CZR0_9FIRM|nr:threonine/serine exporter family protein [[Clostridium] polysaccharolyticum]SET25103.1 Uncharacterized membrane protein YjjP, DUF1212 family [[Clostridium] polysaccharolyticum]